MTIPPITSMPVLPQAPQAPNAPRPMFSSLAIASSGLSAQRVRMDVIAQNLANAETTRTPEGGPYHRRIVNLAPIDPQTMTTTTTTLPATGTNGVPDPSTPGIASIGAGIVGSTPIEMGDATGGVQVDSITEDKTPGALIYDPGNPDADKNGYVQMPNVNMTDELMDLMNVRRLYEANATVFQVARTMLHQSVSI